MQEHQQRQPNRSQQNKPHQQRRRVQQQESPVGAARNAARSILQSRHQSGAHMVSGGSRKSAKDINTSMQKQQHRSPDKSGAAAVRTAGRSVLHRHRSAAGSASSANSRNGASASSASTGRNKTNLGKHRDAVRGAGRSYVNSEHSTGYATSSRGKPASHSINHCVRCNKPVPATARITLTSTRQNGVPVSIEG